MENNNILMFEMQTDKAFKNIVVISIVIIRNGKVIWHETIYLECRDTTEWLSKCIFGEDKNVKSVKSDKELKDWFMDVIKHNKDCEIWTDLMHHTQSEFLRQIKQEDVRNRVNNIMNDLKNAYDFVHMLEESAKDSMIFILNGMKYIFTTYPIIRYDVDAFHEELFNINPEFRKNYTLYELKFFNPVHRCLLNLHTLSKQRNINSRTIMDYYVNNKLFVEL